VSVEIERKFLVRNDTWRAAVARRLEIRQGYLVAEKERSVRVRVSEDQAFLTVKGATHGSERPEFEYEIPVDDARTLLEMCERPLIEKTRHEVPVGAHTFEIDEFHGDNDGLIVAEVELDSADEEFPRPEWIGQDVTDDARYLNANLFRKPFRSW
jgi:adenylate cyclase